MKKIIYVTPGCFDKGGISRYNRYQIKAIQSLENIDIRVLSLFKREKDAFEEDFNIYWSSGGNSIYHRILFVVVLFLQVIIYKPKIILCAHINFSGIVRVLSWLVNAKVVLNVYGLEVWSNKRRDADWGLKKADYLISDCHYTANYIKENNLRKRDDEIEVIWDCVDLDHFAREENKWFYVKNRYNLPDRDKTFIILTLGRLSFAASHKGYERLLIVFSEVVKTIKNARLVFGGKGDMIEHLKHLSFELDIEDKVYFTGMIHDDDMPGIYSYGHVFSLVSDRGEGRGEGIPLTPLEAMSCGTPIIVGNHDGSQEAVINEKNGYVIDPFDLEEHKNKLLLLAEDKELILKKSFNATNVALNYFSFRDFINKHKTFFKRING